MKFTLRAMAMLCAALIVIFSAPVKAHAEAQYISDLSIATGADAVQRLESGGYKVVLQNLNIGSDENAKIYLGYKTGGEPVTDIAVGYSYQSGLVINNTQYHPVSDIDLNRGTDGAAIYLYYTRDSHAGSPVKSLFTLTCGEQDSMAEYPLLNDGSEVVRTEYGDAADLDIGVSGAELYLMKIRSDLCRPYISDIGVVSGAGDIEARRNAVRGGFNYYLERSLSPQSDACTYICYNRTADANKAVTFVAASESNSLNVRGLSLDRAAGCVHDGKSYNIFTSHDRAAGYPVMDITYGRLMAPEFTFGDWIMMYFSGGASSALSQVYSESAYDRLLDDTTACTQLPVGIYDASGLCAVAPVMLIAQDGFVYDIQSDEQTMDYTQIDELEIDETLPSESIFAETGSARDTYNPDAQPKQFDLQGSSDTPAFMGGTPEYYALMQGETSDGDLSGSDVSGGDVSGSDFVGSVFGGSVGAMFVSALAAALAMFGFAAWLVQRAADRKAGEESDE